jgi:hypothetical protein
VGLGFASDLRLRRRYRPVAGASATGVIAFGRAGSLALKDSRMDALAVTALAQLDQCRGTPHDSEVPFL